MGSPVTHKWCWDFYTPKKRILEIFEYSNEGYIEALEIEKRIIIAELNDRWCLNENVGGIFSLITLSKAGKKGGTKSYELGVGLHSLTTEERIELGRKVGQKSYELGTGVFGISKQKRIETNKKSNETCRKNRTGLYSIPKEQRSETAKRNNTQKWMCLETGFITNSGSLSRYQKSRGIDTSKRKRIL
jgi:hypothetical protein